MAGWLAGWMGGVRAGEKVDIYGKLKSNGILNGTFKQFQGHNIDGI